MKTRFTTIITAVVVIATGTQAADLYVAPGGDDANSGTEAQPLATIQAAVNKLQPGDTLLIRGGTYRETVTFPRSGTADKPITLKPYRDEKVIVSGCEPVTGWPLHEPTKQIWKAPLPWTLGLGRNQVFGGGQVLIEARHPNAPAPRLEMYVADLSPLWPTYGAFSIPKETRVLAASGELGALRGGPLRSGLPRTLHPALRHRADREGTRYLCGLCCQIRGSETDGPRIITYDGKDRWAQKTVTLALHDLTGFAGRCDALLFTANDGAAPPNDLATLTSLRRKLRGLPEAPLDAGEYDLVVVGGGAAGCCAAVSAARLGCKVALIHDRPVLGGNNSSEVRVGLSGLIHQQPYPRLGDLVDEWGPVGHWNLYQAKKAPELPRSKEVTAIIEQHPEKKIHNAGPASNYENEKKLAVVQAEKNLTLFLGTRANGVEIAGKRIATVIAEDIKTGLKRKFQARLVADCTGDGVIGALAGADFAYGRESKSEFGEDTAPPVKDELVVVGTLKRAPRYDFAAMIQPVPLTEPVRRRAVPSKTPSSTPGRSIIGAMFQEAA